MSPSQETVKKRVPRDAEAGRAEELAMGAQLRVVRRRIRTVQSTKKITRAKELIASSRIVKAQQRAHDAVPYARELTARSRPWSAVVADRPSADLGADEPQPARRC